MSLLPSPDYDEADLRPNSPAPEEGAAFERDPIQIVRDGQAEAYCQLVQSLIRGGKPNSTFPSGRGVENLIYLLRPSVNRGLSNEIQVNLKTGLPHEPNIGRVIADKDVCQKILRAHDVDSVHLRQDEASQRLVHRIEYYREVERRELPERFQLDLKLKRTDENEQTADFIAIFERFDPGEGIFTRYTIHLRHKNQRWAKPKVELQGDDLRYTEEFRNVISRYSSHEAEFAFILLSDVSGITVEEVSRGRIGPLWMTGVEAPEPIAELLKAHPGNAILNFPQEKVFVPEVEGKTDDNRDPFSRMYRASLGAENKELADARAASLGYVVHKERKFACTKPLVAPLKQLMVKLGKPCVVYPAR